MKKIIASITAFFLLALSVSFAADSVTVPGPVARALMVDFEKPSNIEWKATNTFYKASFTSGTTALEAFYNEEGVLIATSRNITMDQLPLSLQKDLKRIAPVYHEEELFEMLSDKGTEYFVKFNNGKEVKTFKSNTESWTRY
jgi:hypothetical protein